MIDKCTDCSAPAPEMFNCDADGERIDGLLCYSCWKDKHPVMQRTESRINYGIIIWGSFLLWMVFFIMYKIWSYAI